MYIYTKITLKADVPGVSILAYWDINLSGSCDEQPSISLPIDALSTSQLDMQKGQMGQKAVLTIQYLFILKQGSSRSPGAKSHCSYRI